MLLRRDSLARSRRRALQRVAPGPLRDALAVPLPDADVAVGRLPLLAVDVETTGLRPGSDRVLSIGWVPVDGRGVVLAGARYRVVRPDAVACAELYLAQSAEIAHGRPLLLRRLLAR